MNNHKNDHQICIYKNLVFLGRVLWNMNIFYSKINDTTAKRKLIILHLY